MAIYSGYPYDLTNLNAYTNSPDNSSYNEYSKGSKEFGEHHPDDSSEFLGGTVSPYSHILESERER